VYATNCEFFRETWRGIRLYNNLTPPSSKVAGKACVWLCQQIPAKIFDNFLPFWFRPKFSIILAVFGAGLFAPTGVIII